MPAAPTRQEHSAGGVVYRGGGPATQIALAARRTRAGDLAWGLPKGAFEPGEQPDQAALREVHEETGLEAEIRESLGDISYWYWWEGVRVHKRVTFFLMEATGGDISVHDAEMEDVRWFPAVRSVRTAAFPSEKEVLRRALAALGLPERTEDDARRA